MRRILASNEKPLHWVGSSKRDFLDFPEPVGDEMGNALGVAQFGGMAPTAKPWKGLGPGVLENRRVARRQRLPGRLTVRFADASYVLHAFQKKSPSGIPTAKHDVDLVAQRLRAAQRDYEAHHGKATR